MIVIGLTGGIGSGKSFVADYFIKKNIPVYNSDIRAKELMVSDSAILKKLIQKFGPEVYTNKQLNRPHIAHQVFNNPPLLKWLNELVHPRVQTDFKDWCQANSHSPIVLKEAAILIESDAYKACHFLVVVTAPTEKRIERVMARDNMSYQEVAARMKNQLSDEERIKLADFVIQNDGLAEVEPQIDQLLQTIKAKTKYTNINKIN